MSSAGQIVGGIVGGIVGFFIPGVGPLASANSSMDIEHIIARPNLECDGSAPLPESESDEEHHL